MRPTVLGRAGGPTSVVGGGQVVGHQERGVRGGVLQVGLHLWERGRPGGTQGGGGTERPAGLLQAGAIGHVVRCQEAAEELLPPSRLLGQRGQGEPARGDVRRQQRRRRRARPARGRSGPRLPRHGAGKSQRLPAARQLLPQPLHERRLQQRLPQLALQGAVCVVGVGLQVAAGLGDSCGRLGRAAVVVLAHQFQAEYRLRGARRAAERLQAVGVRAEQLLLPGVQREVRQQHVRLLQRDALVQHLAAEGLELGGQRGVTAPPRGAQSRRLLRAHALREGRHERGGREGAAEVDQVCRTAARAAPARQGAARDGH
mmetsp:Transcript_16842/g.43148  ORF Transcript_16842/g.43148 Transcript_16842/m.43148 type:complete len:315 (-) Transcript_16842:2632-3576(-)